MEEPMEVDNKRPKVLTWTEKYRPKTLDDIAYQDEVVTMLKGALQGRDLPHLLFYGPPGTGKTSAALAFCRQLFPKNIFHDRVLDLNASDERGIAVVRQKIQSFSKSSLGHSHREDVLKLKIIILDEVDAMTREAQAAMRRVIEDFSKTTRFILICNYVSRLIPPVVSRCAKFRFKSLPAEIQVQRLRTICDAEGTPMSDDELKQVMEYSEGDLRRAVCTLQSLAPILKSGDDNARNCYLRGSSDSLLISNVCKSILTADVPQIIALTKDITKSCTGVAFIRRCFQQLMDEDVINDENIGVMGKLVATCEKRILDGCDLENNLLDFLLTLRETIQ
ncbi:Replication factor C subunit 4 [Caenorhabditis elegans]|uniref:Replication factor C subunit 4 n=1 Tax=Caenorhabditis elegans TaxID=6239 RepID=RFC4_CAEEL|nr:Replication factor C subunit 4 [Caenorhabditis elegans]P53016.1 RecName: Full=Replication factor C subunit 4; AltName: Full=Activator 1 subunit 4 [Caenorhabditis elegans]CCD63405.1 Replication factor C subunit 4 [Caenorhabditis elegans]|eukprot:NP_498521.1 Replication factor C subunit 4 [Caenorhabditis elegans]